MQLQPGLACPQPSRLHPAAAPTISMRFFSTGAMPAPPPRTNASSSSTAGPPAAARFFPAISLDGRPPCAKKRKQTSHDCSSGGAAVAAGGGGSGVAGAGLRRLNQLPCWRFNTPTREKAAADGSKRQQGHAALDLFRETALLLYNVLYLWRLRDWRRCAPSNTGAVLSSEA